MSFERAPGSRGHQVLFASRPDLSEGQREFLAGRPLEEAAALLAQVPAPAGRAGAVRASRSTQAADIAQRFGRALKAPEIHWEGNELVLPQISRAAARKVLAARGHELPANRPLLPTDASNMGDVRREIMTAALSARGRVVSE